MAVPGGSDWLILDTANKHGVDDADIMHALEHHYRTWQQDDGMTMYIGPSRTGQMLEIGKITWYGIAAVTHAMPARDRYL